MASTVLPNGIIIPEKYSRDWYNDLYHNWQELDNLLGGGTPKDGTLTIQKNGDTVGTFSANQATNETIDITVPTKTSDLTNDSDFVPSTDLASVATSGSYDDLTNKPTIPTVNNATLTIQKNGTNVQTFTANQSTNATANITVPTKTSDLTNDSGFITSDNTKIPLVGSNAISGDLIPSTNETYRLGNSNMRYRYIGGKYGEFDIINPLNEEMTIFSSSKAEPWKHGAYLSIFGEDYSGDSQWANAFRLGSVNSNTKRSYVLLGDSSGNLTWNGQSIQTTSDARLKQQISEIDDDLLTAWEDVNPVQFKYNDAVKEKSDNARLHTGYVVQQIDEACKKHNVDVSKYGLYCHEEYAEETREVEQADGTKKTEVVRPANEHYSLRYTEALIVECAYLRKCIKELRNEIEELKSSK